MNGQAVHILLGTHGIELLVNTDFLCGNVDIVVWDKGFLVGFDSAVGNNFLPTSINLLASLYAKFIHSLIYHLLEGLIPHIHHKPALLGSKQVAGSADVQVLHCDVESAAQIGEFFYSAEAPARIFRNRCQWRHNQIAESLAVGTPHTTAELVKVA